ncbi:tripartite tricarboxylate transporter substrate binding protein [Variovorax defluvii]|uniref:Tripartite tricarboxylate transporter substrate binding protein n=2 Tax=Variovorax defluvii TaxID=913761 RepID=A0ABP8GVV8_9BURK
MAAAVAAPLPISQALASQTYPPGPVRVVVPFPPGGPTDVVGRVIAQRLSEAFKRPFVVENKAGASGLIGADAVAKAAPDGLTLLANVSAQVINPYLYAKLPHDPMKDFLPVTSLASTPIQLVVSSSLPVKSVQDLVNHVKARPGQCSFASSSSGTPGHLAGELFRLASGIDALHAPYKGSAPALTDVMSGQVTFMFDSMPSSIGLVKGGKLRALGVTGTQRAASLPGVPTMVEAGYPDMTMTTWYGLWAPAKTPMEIAKQLQAEVSKALAYPDVKALLAEVSADGMGDTPEVFAAFCRSESERYARIIKTANIKLE